MSQVSDACSSVCHGSGGVAAPPRDTSGRSDTTAIGVGAHRAHLDSSTWHKRFECSTCHKVPQQIGEPGHIDDALPAEVTLTGMGEGGVWDRDTQSCSNTYCHGATLTNSIGGMSGPAGGTATVPVWTTVDGSQSACGSCHGAPPPAPHPPDTDCGTCHPTMIPGNGMVIAYPELHIDGRLDVVNTAACDSCHGQNGQSAPPVDTNGGTATTLRGVGAHAAHMTTSSTWHAPLDCSECHRVPAGINDQGHIDTGAPAELVWGPLAGGTSTWNGTSCSNTYCHALSGVLPPGQTSAGGSAMSPTWTLVDGSQTACGSCHGAPPPPPHPSGTNCGTCHPTMNGAPPDIAYPALHINGVVDVTGEACDSCHGENGVSAPPKDTTGGTTTDLRTVGAHRNHLNPSTWRRDVVCEDCHRVPAAVFAIGHIDTPRPAELTFSLLAGNASWNGSTCNNTYCHGASLGGGTSKNPVWTNVNGTQGQCGSCHGTPPPAPHPSDSDCGKCHNTMMAGDNATITDPARHIDGNLDVDGDLPCNECHGSTTSNAPPRDTQNNTTTGARGVGAHQQHLATTNRFKPVACSDCHRVPATMNAVGHRDTPLPAELTFSSFAGTSTAWNGSRCSNNYCHGSTLSGGTAKSPIWTILDGTYRACTACHGNPPTSPPHTPADTQCGPTCHDNMSNGTTFSAPSRHVDGNVDANVNLACNGVCHGTTNNAPPADTQGNTSTSARGVGAHQAHIAPGGTAWHRPVTCEQCHRVPATVNASGHRDTALPAELTFTGIAVPSAWNGNACTSYCHGSTLAAGGAATSPVWTTVNGSQSQCGSCHGNPPPSHSGYSNNTQCTNCHQSGGTGGTFTDAALHIDGTLQVTAVHPPGYDAREMHGYDFDKMGPSTCATSSCHGTALTGGANVPGPSCVTCHANAGITNWQTNCQFCHGGTQNTTGAPPEGVLGQTAATDRHVGAHTTHVTAGAMAAAFACSVCHTNPTSAVTPGHVDGTGGVVQAEVRYSALNPSATYSPTTATCANLYCHGNGRTSAGTETWTSTTAMTCSSCHLSPAVGAPATGMSGEHDKHIRDKRIDCTACHQTVVNAARSIVGPALHVNGLKDVKMPVGTWTPATKTCSGLPGNCHGTKKW